MKCTTIVIALAALVLRCDAQTSWSLTTIPIELLCENQPDGTFLAHPEDCSKFLECVDGVAIVEQCPAGTEWNETIESCDLPQDVSCHAQNNVTTTQNSLCGGLSEGAFLPDPYDCSKFYECSNGVPIENSCPPGTLWNQEGPYCDFPNNVHCKVTTLYPGETTTLDPICGSLPDGSFVAHPYDCSKFYECADGVPVENSCPAGTLWDEEEETCDFPANVHCNVSTLYPGQTTTVDPICGDLPDGSLVGDLYDCTTFYECANGVPIAQHCGSGTEWNQEGLYCDTPQNANCTAVTYAPITTTLEPGPGCDGQSYGTYVEHPSHSRKFYVCIDDETFEFECPEYAEWDEKNELCSY